MNEKAEIIVKTPVGDCEAFTIEDIVRQGSVYGPQICVSSMDKINILGKDTATYYGPELAIKAGIFVDDITGMGGIASANNTIYNCSLMEEKKKMSFNNKNGKTEYMIIGKSKEEVRTVSEKVKRGHINRVTEHKLVGTWLDETGNYGINNTKRRTKLNFMISSIKRQACPSKIGQYAIEGRIRLAETVVIKSLIFDIETFPVIKEEEIRQLESMQLLILTGIMDLPRTTPYCALLMEVGSGGMVDDERKDSL